MTAAANESSTKFASIDVGSHTIRLLIAELEQNTHIVPLRVERTITRLARDFHNSQELSPASMESSITALETYQELLEDYGVGSVACGATGVFRRAANSADFLERVRKALGLNIAILSEDSEAALSAKGILSVLPDSENWKLLFDLGGSSTEFLLVNPQRSKPVWSESIFLGAATISARYLDEDPPKIESVKLAVKSIEDQIDEVLSEMKTAIKEAALDLDDLLLVGTAGTATTLASMFLSAEEYQPQHINGLVLDERWLSDTAQRLTELTIAQRQGIPGLERGREDIILGGALVVLEILRATKKQQFTVTDAGLLEGLLLDLIEKERGMPQVLSSPLTWLQLEE